MPMLSGYFSREGEQRIAENAANSVRNVEDAVTNWAAETPRDQQSNDTVQQIIWDAAERQLFFHDDAWEIIIYYRLELNNCADRGEPETPVDMARAVAFEYLLSIGNDMWDAIQEERRQAAEYAEDEDEDGEPWQQCALCWNEATQVGATPADNRCDEHANE